MIPLTVFIVWLVSFKMAEKTSVDSSAGKVTQLPIARVKTIMKSSPEQPHFSQDSVFLITKATELFIDYLTITAYKQESDSKQLTYKGLSKVVEDEEKLQFLGDIVPPKVLVKDFLESLKKKSRMSPFDVDSSSSESE